MTNCEHLIENALIRMEKTIRFGGRNVYEDFQYEMSLHHNKEMLSKVNVTEKELWEIAQYVMYVWNSR